MPKTPAAPTINNKLVIAATAIIVSLGGLFAAFEHFWKIPELVEKKVEEKIGQELATHIARAKKGADEAEAQAKGAGGHAANAAAAATTARASADAADAAKAKALAKLAELEAALEAHGASARQLAAELAATKARLDRAGLAAYQLQHALAVIHKFQAKDSEIKKELMHQLKGSHESIEELTRESGNSDWRSLKLPYIMNCPDQ